MAYLRTRALMLSSFVPAVERCLLSNRALSRNALLLFVLIINISVLAPLHAATITAAATGNWSATAWPNTTRTGQITTSNASPNVTGVGTSFLTQVSVGNIIKTVGNVVIGTVLSVNSNTSITLTANAASNNTNINFNVQGIGPGDDAVISGNFTVTLDGNYSINSVAVNASTTANGTSRLTIGAFTLTVANNVTMQGGNNASRLSTILFNNNSSVLTVGGSVTIGNGSTGAATIDMSNGGANPAANLNIAGSMSRGTEGVFTSGTASTVTYNGASPSVAPFSYRNLVISVSGTASTSGNTTVTGNLSISNGATFSIGNSTFAVTGTTTVGGGTSGALTITANNTRTFTGLVTIASGATWTNTAANSAVTFRGGITNNGTFNAGTGVHTFDTNSQALTGNLTIPSVTVTGGAVTLTNNNSLTVGTALSGTGALTQAVGATLNIGGTSGITTLNATNTGNTVNYTGAGQTVHSNNYHHLTLSGSGTKTLQTGTTAINGDFTFGGTASATAVTGLTIGANFILGTGTTFAGGAFTHNLAGNWSNNGGTFTNTNSTIYLNGTTQSIGGSSSTTFNNLALAGSGTKTFGAATAVASNLLIGTGVVANPGSITTHTANTLILGTTSQAAGTWGSTSSGAANQNNTFFTAGTTGRFTVATTLGSQTYYSISTGNWNSSTTWSTVSFVSTTNTGLFPIAGDVVNIGGGNYTITVASDAAAGSVAFEFDGNNSPTLSLNSAVTLDVSGNIDIPRANFGDNNTLAVGAGILNAGSISFTNGGGFNRHELTISTGTVTVTGDITQDGSTGSATITFTGAGTLNLGGAFLDTSTGSFTASTGTVVFNGADQSVGDFDYNNLTLTGSGTKDLSGQTAIGGSLTMSGSATTSVGALTIGTNLDLSGTSALTTTSTLAVGNNLTLAGTAALTAGGNITITGGVTLGSGTAFTAGSNTHNVAGGWTNNGATFTNTNSTINFNGGAQNIGGSASTTFNNLTLAGTGASTKTLGISTTISGTLTVANTILVNPGSITTHTARTFVYNSTGQVSGTWGSTSSGATNQSNAIFTAATTGRITVSNRSFYTRLTAGNAGAWSTAATWSNTGFGGAASASTPAAGDDVYIGGANNITVNVTAAAASATLTFQGATGNTTTVSISSGITLTVSGLVTIARPNGGSTNTLAVGAGALSAGGLTFSGTTGGTNSLTISTGTATISGDVTKASGASNPTITFSSTGTMNLGGAFLSSANVNFTPSTGTVAYNGTNQTVTNVTYNNLTLSGSGTKTFAAATTVGSNFTLSGAVTAVPSAAVTVTGVFTLGSGTTFTAGSFTHNVAGNWVNNGGTFSGDGSTVNFNGAAQNIGGSASTSFNHVSLTGSGTKTLGISTNVGGNLYIATGIVCSPGAITTHTASTLTFAGANQVAGTWGSTSSSATNQNNTFFLAGTTGRITVSTTLPPQTYYSIATGNWSSATTWSTVGFTSTVNTGSFPLAGDVVNIGGGSYTVTVAADAACGSITYEAGQSNSPTVSLNSGVTLAVSGDIELAASNFFDTNTLAVGAGTLTAGSITYTDGFLFNNHELTISTGTATVSGNISGGTFFSANLTFSGAGLLQIGGTLFGITEGVLTEGTGTVEYNGAAQTVSEFTYYNLTLSGSGVKTLTNLTTIGNNFTMAGTASATAGAEMDINGTVTLGTGTTFVPSAYTHTVAGNWTNNGGTFTSTGSTITFDGAGQTIGGTTASTFNTVNMNGSGTKTLGLSTTFGSLSIAAGVVCSPGSITTHTARSLLLNGAGQAAGTWGSTSSGATNQTNTFFTAGTTGRITVAGRAFFTRAGGNWGTAATWSNAGYNGAAASSTPAANDDVYIGGGNYNVTVAAGVTVGSVTFNSNATDSPTLTVNSGITLTVTNAIAIPRAANGDVNTLAVGQGILNAGSIAFTEGGVGQRHVMTISTGTATVTGDIIQSGSTGSATITFSGAGTLNVGGAFLNSSNATFTASTGTVVYNGTSQTVGDFTYNNLTLSGSGTKTITDVATIGGNFVMGGTAATTAENALDINGSVTLGAGTSFTAGAFSHTVAGAWSNNGATFNATGSTFTFDGAAQAIGGTSANSFENVAFTGSGTKTLNTVTTMSGNLSIATSIVCSPTSLTTHTARTLTLGGNGQASGTWGSTSSGATNQTNTFFTAGTTGRITISARQYFTRQAGNWNAAASWSTVTYGNATNGGTFPGSNDDVFVGGGNFTTTVNVNSSCGTLTFESGAGNSPTVSINSGISLTVSGAVTIPRTGFGDSNTLAVGDGTFSAASLAFTNGGGGQRHFLTINNGTATITGNITESGSTGSASITFTGTGTLNIGGSMQLDNSNSTFTAGTGTVVYNGTGQTISDLTYHGLTLSGSGTKSVAAALTVGGNFTLNSGPTFVAGSFTHNVAGNWVNNGGTFTNTGSTINLNGTAAQTIGGSASSTFNNLTFNNSSGTIPQIVLAINTNVNNRLTMTSGVVNLAGFTFTLGSASVNSTLIRTSSSTTNWMYGGTFARYWPAATTISSTAGNFYGLFPVGASTASSYRPVSINSTVNPTAGGTFSVTHTSASTVTDLSPTFSDGGTNVVRKHNAQFVTATTATGGTYNIGVTMTGLYNSGSLSDIRLAVNNGATTVTTVGTHAAATGSVSNPTANRTGVSLANLVGDFRITTANSATTPLPIELVKFTADQMGDEILLQWTTASELNNDFFTIHKLNDKDGFDEVIRVKGQGTTNVEHNYSAMDANPKAGKNYYRLMQTDFDGRVSYSEIVAVNFDASGNALKVYPNPVKQTYFTVQLKNLLPGQKIPMSLRTPMGVTLSQSDATADESGAVNVNISTDRMTPGLYLLHLNVQGGLVRKIIIE